MYAPFVPICSIKYFASAQKAYGILTIRVFLKECASLARWQWHICTLLNGNFGIIRHKVMTLWQVNQTTVRHTCRIICVETQKQSSKVLCQHTSEAHSFRKNWNRTLAVRVHFFGRFKSGYCLLIWLTRLVNFPLWLSAILWCY